jgi:hypothetical protein
VASDKDVLGRADALLRRSATGSDTGSVPVLTELVGEPPVTEPPAVELSSGLAQEVFAQVLEQVQGRLAADIERRLSERFATDVHQAVTDVMGDMREELAQAIASAVAEALARHAVK